MKQLVADDLENMDGRAQQKQNRKNKRNAETNEIEKSKKIRISWPPQDHKTIQTRRLLEPA